MLPTIKTIVYASDLGEKTRPVINMAARLAKEQGARLVCVHVVAPLPEFIHSMMGDGAQRSKIDSSFAENTSRQEAAFNTRLATFFDEELGGDTQALHFEARVVVGQVEEAILQIARQEQADLIVVGSRTHSGIQRLMLGSSATQLVHNSQIPVLVVPIY